MSWVDTGPGSSIKLSPGVRKKPQLVPPGSCSADREDWQGNKAVTLDAGCTDPEWVVIDAAWLLTDDLVLSLDNPWNESQPGVLAATASSGELPLPFPPIHFWGKAAFPIC